VNVFIKKVGLLLSVLLLINSLAISALDNSKEKRLALIGFENMDEDDQHDYLSALITAVIREDLSHTDGIALLERVRMDEVLDEQKMQISGLFDDLAAVEAGKLLGSDFLCGGGFIVMDTEVLIDITLIDVETSRVISFSSRGNSEDIIHLAAEKIARELTGERKIFRTSNTDRPIIKETLMPPGSLKLFTPLINARIYIDGEFFGYTIGDSTIPIEIELQPGLHSVSTDLGSDFGVIKEPEIIFEKWKREFNIKSGRTVVLEDPTRHFNDRLYRLQQVVREDKTFYIPGDGPFDTESFFDFTDRGGNPVKGSLTIHFTPSEAGGLEALIMLVYGHERKVFELKCAPDEEVELKQTVGVIDLEVDLESRYSNRVEADWSIWRNDIYQGLHRE
jgi:TolB-like protein